MGYGMTAFSDWSETLYTNIYQLYNKIIYTFMFITQFPGIACDITMATEQ